jgi:hypothetical protein
VATFEERIYSLGVDTLAEQERQVAEVRGRASVLLAAGRRRSVAARVEDDGSRVGAAASTA